MAGEGLTEKQKKFAERYAANGGNATEAAEFAGYSIPKEQGYENLTKPHIADYIRTLAEPARTERILSAAEIQQFWTRVVLGLEEDMKSSDRLKASELLAKSTLMFVERHQITADVESNKKVVFEIIKPDGNNKAD